MFITFLKVHFKICGSNYIFSYIFCTWIQMKNLLHSNAKKYPISYQKWGWNWMKKLWKKKSLDFNRYIHANFYLKSTSYGRKNWVGWQEIEDFWKEAKFARGLHPGENVSIDFYKSKQHFQKCAFVLCTSLKIYRSVSPLYWAS